MTDFNEGWDEFEVADFLQREGIPQNFADIFSGKQVGLCISGITVHDLCWCTRIGVYPCEHNLYRVNHNSQTNSSVVAGYESGAKFSGA